MWGLDPAWRERLLSYRQLVVGFSGGLDSTVLLHLIAREPAFLDKLQAVHVHHGLSAHADVWQAHCKTFCVQHHIQYLTQSVVLENNANIEEAARLARHNVFDGFIETADCLLLAHHKDDQAETVLLNLLRGTGVEGLAAMPAIKPFGKGHLARPLLAQTRDGLQAYANHHQLVWVEDESNQDTHFTRNYLRHDILPRLKLRWPQAVDAINTCAKHAESATKNLEDLAYLDCPTLGFKQDKLVLAGLCDLPRARLIQVLRVWLRQQGIQSPQTRVLDVLMNEVIFAKQDAMPCLQLGEAIIRRYRDTLYVLYAKACTPSLPVLLDTTMSVRFRSGGECMVWRGHTRSLKKIFQTLGVPPWLRDKIPLVFIGNRLVEVLDFALADGYHKSHVKEDVYDTV